MTESHRKLHRRPRRHGTAEATLGAGRGMTARQEQVWACFCHLGAFLAFILPFSGMVLGPLVLWLLRRDASQFVNREGKKAVNFQLSVFVYLLMGLVLTWAYIGYAILTLLLCVDIVCVVAASLKANNGEDFQYPLTIQFIR